MLYDDKLSHLTIFWLFPTYNNYWLHKKILVRLINSEYSPRLKPWSRFLLYVSQLQLRSQSLRNWPGQTWCTTLHTSTITTGIILDNITHTGPYNAFCSLLVIQRTFPPLHDHPHSALSRENKGDSYKMFQVIKPCYSRYCMCSVTWHSSLSKYMRTTTLSFVFLF